MVVVIVLLCLGYAAYERWLKERTKSRALSLESGVKGEAETRIRELEERVEVLERILTDERYDLKRQISNL